MGQHHPYLPTLDYAIDRVVVKAHQVPGWSLLFTALPWLVPLLLDPATTLSADVLVAG